MCAILKSVVLVLILSTSVYFIHSHPISSAKDGGMSSKFEPIKHVLLTVATEDCVSSAVKPKKPSLGFLCGLRQKEQQSRNEGFKGNNTKDEAVNSTSRTNGLASRRFTINVKGGDYLNRSAMRSTVSCMQSKERRQATHSCVKRIVKTYHAARDEIVTQYECRKASLYCSQTQSGLGRCQPIKTYHPSLGRILTTGCKCKP